MHLRRTHGVRSGHAIKMRCGASRSRPNRGPGGVGVGAPFAVIPHVTSQEAYVEAIIEREDARKRTGLFGSASPAALDAKLESARLTAKVDTPYVRAARAGRALAACLERAAHRWSHARAPRSLAAAARWAIGDYQVLCRLPSLAKTRKAQLAAELAKVSAQLASLKATFDSGAAAHDSKTAASLNRRMAKQRQLGEGAYQRYLAWNQQVPALRRPPPERGKVVWFDS